MFAALMMGALAPAPLPMPHEPPRLEPEPEPFEPKKTFRMLRCCPACGYSGRERYCANGHSQRRIAYFAAIDVAEDFSPTPGGRLAAHGEYSGEAFYADHLEMAWLWGAERQGSSPELRRRGSTRPSASSRDSTERRRCWSAWSSSAMTTNTSALTLLRSSKTLGGQPDGREKQP